MPVKGPVVPTLTSTRLTSTQLGSVTGGADGLSFECRGAISDDRDGGWLAGGIGVGSVATTAGMFAGARRGPWSAVGLGLAGMVGGIWGGTKAGAALGEHIARNSKACKP
jgi:hypothetical protein